MLLSKTVEKKCIANAMHFSVSLTQNLVVLLFAGAENECDTCESFSNENGDGAGQLCFGLFGDSGL